jgi:hypothetical protein
MRLTATQVARKRHERSGLAWEVVMFRCQIDDGIDLRRSGVGRERQ